MNDVKSIELAERYLSSMNIGYLLPGKVGRRESNHVEVVFSVPGTEDPAVAVVDPPDVRVLVKASDGSVELIFQM